MIQFSKFFNYLSGYRFVARQIDYLILFFIYYILETYLNLNQYYQFSASTLLITLTLLFLWNFIEAGLLLKFNTTLGKAFFGIKIYAPEDKNNYSYYLKRSFLVYLVGTGAGLPVINNLLNFVAYIHLQRKNKTYWDNKLNFEVIHKPVNIFVRLGAILIALLLTTTYLSHKIKNNYQEPAKLDVPILDTIEIPYPEKRVDVEVSVKQWVDACVDGGQRFAKDSNYSYIPEALEIFCEQAANQYIDSENEMEAATVGGCGMGFAYIYAQINGADPKKVEAEIVNFQNLMQGYCLQYMKK